MKAKMSFDSQKLKQFFVAHVEKIAFLVFLVICGLMVYSAFKVNRIELTPARLSQDVAQTSDSVTKKPWDPANQDVRIPNPPFVEQGKKAMKEVDGPLYALAVPFNPPTNDNRLRRDKPKYLAATDVRATFGFGPVKLKGEGTAGKQWAMVTALVPVGEQTAEFQKMFQAALFQDKNKDVPVYLEFEIERKEPSGEWAKLDVPVVWKEIDEKYGEFIEVVDKKHLDLEALTFRLPGLASGEYGAAAAHPDEIPLGAQVEAPKAAAPAAAPAVGGAAPKMPEAGAATPAAAAATPARRRGARAPAAEEKGDKAAEVAVEAVRYKLLRFIDYTVENVKSYQYRVRLILANPNFEVQAQFLKNPALASEPEGFSEWSEPSKQMKTPRDNYWLAGTVKPATGTNESKAKIVIVQWAKEHATEAKQVFEVNRGEWLNFKGQSSKVPVPGTVKVKEGTVDYVTNSLFLDMTGGDSLTVPNSTRLIKAPAEMLVMGPDGTISIRTQVDDSVEFNKGQAASAATVETDAPEVGAAEGAAGAPGETAPAGGRPRTATPFSLPK